MAKITLQIVGNVADIQQRIATVKQDLASIGQQPVRITVDTNGLNAIEQTAIRAANAQARLINAQARMREAEDALALARERTAQEVQRRIVSENNLARQMEATATAEEQARRANIQLTTEIERQNTAGAQLLVQQERTNTEFQRTETQAERTQTELVRLERATIDAGNAGERAGQQFTMFGRLVDRLQWRVINAAVSTMANSLRTALNTMKEVDQQLVVVRKVTGASAEDLEVLKDRAYETASAYGVAADAYLESVAAFARAGYGDMSADAAELAVKTQLVGDTTAETANQFLISVDKAYKYQGSIEKLSAVLDGANELDNKYATSIEKIAEGMGIVAPIASQVHVEIDELAAAIGTITAVTQRSGSETARALRALFLNIVGDTKTEIDEGVTWTTGEIAGLRDVIKLYAPEAYAAAQATGAVIDPMEAMAGLAQSMKDGLLTEADLMAMVSDIGGKLRSSQLLALIQNWDMYQSMLQDYAGAVGSADKEVQNALTAWNAKTEILKNTWTEFVEGIIDTDVAKGALDGLITIVNGLDTGFGRLVVQIGAVGTALYALVRAFSTNPILAGILTAVGVVGWAVGEYKKKDAEHQQYLADSYGELYNLQDALGNVGKAGGSASLTTKDKDALYYQAQRAAEERADYMVRIANARKRIAEIDKELAGTTNEGTINRLLGEKTGLTYAVSEWTRAVGEYGTALNGVSDAIGDYTPAQESMYEGLEETEEATLSLTEQIEAQQAALEALNTEIDNTQSALATITAAQEEYNETGGLSVDTIQSLLSLDKEYLDALIDENGQINLNSEAVSTLIDGKNVLIEKLAAESIANYAAEEAQRLLAIQTGNAATAADNAAISVADAALAALQSGNDAAMGATGWAVFWKAVQGETIDAGLSEEYREQLYNNVAGYAADVQALIRSATVGGGGWTPKGTSRSNGGGSSSSGKDEELERRKSTIEFLKAELALMQERGDSEEEQIAKMREIQEALHDEADYLRTIEGESANVKDLSTEWWQYQNKIADLYDDIAEKQRQILEDMKAAENDQYQSLIDNLSNAKEIADENLEIEEKKLAVLEAQANLINAQNERTIRYWNAKTGQWEWAANQQDVQAAQDALTSAQKDLNDAYRQKQINDLQRAQAAAAAAWESRMALPASTQDAILGAMSQGSLSWEQASGIVSGNASASAAPLITSGAQYSGNFGTVYQFGNLTIGEAQAQNLTIGQLATMLGIYLPTQASTY